MTPVVLQTTEHVHAVGQLRCCVEALHAIVDMRAVMSRQQIAAYHEAASA